MVGGWVGGGWVGEDLLGGPADGCGAEISSVDDKDYACYLGVEGGWVGGWVLVCLKIDW